MPLVICRCIAMRIAFWVNLLLYSSLATANPDITFYLEDEPIYTSSSKTSPGILMELVLEMSKHLNIQPDIQFYPWKRAQINTIKTPNAIIFPLTRIPSREKKYNWVCKLFDVPVMFINKQGQKIINSVNDARQLTKVASVIGSAQGETIKSFHIKDVIQVKGAVLYNLLSSGRVDAIYTAQPEAIYAWKQQPYEGKLQFGKTQQVLSLWIASSKQSDKISNQQWQQALQKIKDSGFFDRKLQEYFGKP